MDKKLVFEIGTEEMPAAAAREGAVRLRVGALALFERYRLAGGGVECRAYATPRRLVLLAEKLPEEQAEMVETVKGPAERVAFAADGSPTAAAVGFARSQGVEVDQLQVREAAGGSYLFAEKHHPGLPTVDVLPELLGELAQSFEFTKTMRWGSGRFRFIRPVRWLLAVYGKELIKVELDGLVSGRLTYGHRFLADGPFELSDAQDYLDIMEKAGVEIDDDRERQEKIRAKVLEAASVAGGRAVINEQVLEEVVYLVEDAQVVVGGFDPRFLKTPRPVVVTAMESHQRYFPVEDQNGCLMPLFAVVHNGDPVWNDQIRAGHERVLAARLADAAFFYAQDTKTSLAAKIPNLDGVIWQAKLGTMREKTERARVLAAKIVANLGLDQKTAAGIDRAVSLAKADLTSAMVIEFPDLQGIVGREYALNDKEDPEIAAAVAEHYRPRFAGDLLPTGVIGLVVALTDKLDTITGCFLAGLIPSGSADPYALRRQAAGVVAILAHTRWSLSLTFLVETAASVYADTDVYGGWETAAAEVRRFLEARLTRWLGDSGIKSEAIEAVMELRIDNVAEIVDRTHLITSLRDKKELEDAKVAFTRCQNLAKPEVGDAVDQSLFEVDEETRLWQRLKSAKEEIASLAAADRLAEIVVVLAKLREPIDAFFDAVLIMAPDEQIRVNRLRVLNYALTLSRRVADFSKLP